MSKELAYKKALERERLSRKEAERILEEKSRDLYNSNLALEKLNLELESKVSERTKELVQEKERAEKLAMVKSEFLSMLSHEIKNPLNAVIGYTELMSLNDLDDETSDYLSKIQHSSNILQGIINDILVYSKADSEKMDICISSFNIIDEVEKIVTVFEQKAFKKKLNLFVNCPDVVIETDKQKLSQCFINLIGNSIKFTDQGYIEVNVKVVDNDQGRELLCEVKDSGVGISEDEISKLFTPFVQVGDKSAFHKGTGLGLSITKKFVELLGGKIEVKGLSTGCVFSFNIKLAK